jgi:hypothetical protein
MREIKMTNKEIICKYLGIPNSTYDDGDYAVTFEISGAKSHKDAVEKMLEIVYGDEAEKYDQYFVNVVDLKAGKECSPVDIYSGIDMDEDDEESEKYLVAEFWPEDFKYQWPNENVNDYRNIE